MWQTNLWFPHITEKEFIFSFHETYILHDKETFIKSMWTYGFFHIFLFFAAAVTVGSFYHLELVG